MYCKALVLLAYVSFCCLATAEEEKREIIAPDGSSLVAFGDPRSHFCCQINRIQNQHWNTKTSIKVMHQYRTVAFQQKTGYTKCGGLGWGRCSLYKEAYTQQLYTFTQIHEIEDVQFCPDEHITCCHGYTKSHDGNCLRLADFKENPELTPALCRLAQQGLIQVEKVPEKC